MVSSGGFGLTVFAVFVLIVGIRLFCKAMKTKPWLPEDETVREAEEIHFGHKRPKGD